MRIAELSRYSGVTAPTIKFYVREGLLPPGELTSPNQAQYGDEHLRRLKLIRALVDVGGLSIAEAKGVLAAVDAPGRRVPDLLTRARGAVEESAEPGSNDAVAVVDDVVDRFGWEVAPNSALRRDLINVVATIQELGHGEVVSVLDDYARAAERVAATEVAAVESPELRDATEAAALLAVLGGRMFAALRSLAHDAMKGDGTPTTDDAS